MPRPTITLMVSACGVVAVAVVGLLLCRERYVGYDDAWAALWGQQLADGHLPTYEAPFAPTPHPLANAVSAIVSAFGFAPGDALLALTFVAFCAAVLLLGVAGWRLYGPIAGVVAAAVLLTRPSLVRETEYGSTDLWFLALLCGVALVSTGRERRQMVVLALLGLAGLIRPEAWVLSGAYVLWSCWMRPWRAWSGPVAIAVSAPLVWALSDLVITGDPLHSLHGTTSLAAQLDRPRSAAVAVASLPHYLRALMGDVPTALGLAGAVAAVSLLYERSLLVLGAAGLGLMMFLMLGLLGLPLLDRYLLVPAVTLTLLVGVAAGGWQALARGTRPRQAWMVAASAAVLAAAAGVVSDVGAIQDSNDQVQVRAAVQADLLRVLDDPHVRGAVANGGGVLAIPDYRAEPLAALRLGMSPRAVAVSGGGDSAPAVVLTYASVEAQRAFGVRGVGGDAAAVARMEPRGRVLAQTRFWHATSG